MNNNDDKTQIDIVIGDAVLALFREDAPLSGASLCKRLQIMADSEASAERRALILQALREMREELTSARKAQQQDVGGSDNVISLFDNGARDGNTRH